MPKNTYITDDPFIEARARCPMMVGDFQGGEKIPMLKLKDVRKAAKDWETFSSDAPRRVPIPSEGEKWIPWGVHVTRAGDGHAKGSEMEDYNRMMFANAKEHPGEDFYSALNQAEMDGRPLTDEEKEGFAYLAFAGGRDTIIHTMTGMIAYFAKNPEDLSYLRAHPEAINTAAEEFFRLAIPLTHIGRVCPAKTDVQGFEVQSQGRISLTWSAANRDPEVFKNPNEVDLERKPNPHVAFGFGHHNCLGAHHARAIMRSFLAQFPQMVSSVKVLEATPCMEVEKDYTRQIGFDRLVVACEALPAAASSDAQKT
jgi:cytochrome P450